MSRASTTLAAAALVALTASGVANAFTVPDFKGPNGGIASPGYPDFWSLNLAASLVKNFSGGFTLTIAGSDPNVGIFNFPGAAYLVGNERVKLTANFNSVGDLLSGSTYEIDGSLRPSSKPSFGTQPKGYSWSAVPVETLFKASLTAVTVDSKDEALGFQSTDFSGWADQPQFTGGSTTESVWLYSLLSGLGSTASILRNSDWNSFLADIKNHTRLKAGTFFDIASIATVPLPAALWLFGGGLAGLGGLLRRRALST